MAPINVTTSKQQITASVAEDKVTATVTAGFGATGPSGVITVTAPITNAGTTTAANIGLAVGSGLSVSSGSLVVTPGTYATLVGGKVPADQLPSYVDDVLEFANVASLPVTGETGKIYVALNTGRIYRWSGSAYFEISTPPENTDAVPEGATNLYFTNARARNAFGTGTNGQVVTWSGGQWTAANPAVSSVAGKTGAVTLVVADVSGLQTALDGKAAATNPSITGLVEIDGDLTANGFIEGAQGYFVSVVVNGNHTIGSAVSGGVSRLVVDGQAVVLGNDARLSDARTPLAHTHAPSAMTFTATDRVLGRSTSGGGAGEEIVCTSFGRSLLDDADASAARGTLGLGTAAAAATTDFAAASHAHGNITSAGAIGTTSGQIVVTTTGGALTTAATIAASAVSGLGGAATLNVGTTAGTVAAGDHTHTQLHDRSHAITSSSDHTATNWRLFHSNGSGQVVELAFGNNGQALISNGASAAPSWGQAGSTSASDLTSGTLADARLTARARAAINTYLWSSFR